MSVAVVGNTSVKTLHFLTGCGERKRLTVELKSIGLSSADWECDHTLEIRNLLYDYLLENGSIDPESIGKPAVIGKWDFVPEKLAHTALEQDMALLFN